MRLSVAIVTYNRPDALRKALNSLQNQTIKPFEIIVIDDASSPAITMANLTVNASVDIPVRLYRINREVGLSNARNYAIKVSEGDFIGFIDDDCVASETWVEEIQKGIAAGGEILGGPLKPIFKYHPPGWWSEEELGYFFGVGNNKKRDIWGANMVFKKEIFNKIGVFNPRIGRQKGKLLSGEDSDIIHKAHGIFKLFFLPKAVVYHLVKSEKLTINYIIRWSFYSGKSQRIASGPSKLAVFIFISALFNVLYPFSRSPCRLHNIAIMAEQIGSIIC
jgi:glucosyl-dolichyl phosphate glucuronosyltransferase